MLPYYLQCADEGVGLYQLKDGRFQLIKVGPIAPLMCGFGYILAEKVLADFLQSLDLPRTDYREAVIWDRQTDTEYTTHRQLLVGQHFSADQINDIDLDGERLLLMNNQYIFVSPPLKKTLESAGFEYLRFSEGLGGFAG